MKDTVNKKRTSNKIKRTVTTMLAAVMMMTTAASFAASADTTQAVTSMNTSSAMTVRKVPGDPYYGKTGDTAMEMARVSALKAVDGILEIVLDKVPLKSIAAPIIKAGLVYLAGLGCEQTVSTNELAKKLDELEDVIYDALDEQTRKLITSMESTFTAGTFKSDLKALADSTKIAESLIDEDANGTKLTEQDRLVKLASVVGNSENWDENGRLIKQVQIAASDLTGSNAMDKRDMFEMLYETNKHNYKFSGEVIDAVDPYAVKTLIDYIKSAGIALASLSAQQKVLSKNFDASKITDPSLKKKYQQLHNDPAAIRNMQLTIAQSLFGSKVFEENGIRLKGKRVECVFDHYLKFKNKYRAIFIPTGKAISTSLRKVDGKNLIDNSEEKTRTFGNWHLESTNKKDFADRIQNGGNGGITNALSEKHLKDLMDYVKVHKGGDMKGFLEKMGFDLSIKGDARIVTGGGYRESPDYNDNNETPCVKTWFESFEALNINKCKIEEVLWKRNIRRAFISWLLAGGHDCQIKDDSRNLYMFRTASADEVAARENADYQKMTSENKKS